MIWREKLRRNIPGSSWLPDTGYGALAPVTDNYLRTNLARVTGGDRTKALVVYCLRDCWMSWNAAKRILALGYANVVWYPDGTDGWAEADLPLQESMPEPRPSQWRAFRKVASESKLATAHRRDRKGNHCRRRVCAFQETPGVAMGWVFF
jgi:rhodanese-related sulfurtransferase